MPFDFGKKWEEQQHRSPFITNITNQEDIDEIKKISHMLNPNEEVFVVARQSRLKPGGSKLTPNVVFATDRRIIIKDPSMLGLREDIVDIPYDMISSVRIEHVGDEEDGIITAIPKDKAEELLEVIRNGMDRDREVYSQQQQPSQPQ